MEIKSKIQHVNTWAKVFFYSPTNIKDNADILNVESIKYIPREDITSITITSTVHDTAGTFSLSILNNGLVYLDGDNVDKSIKDLITLGLKVNEDDKKTASLRKQGKKHDLDKSEDFSPNLFTYYRDENDYNQFRYEYFLSHSGKRFRIYSDITEKDLKAGQNIGIHKRNARWYFDEDKKDKKGNVPVKIVKVTVDKDNKVSYLVDGKDVTEFIKWHTNSEFVNTYGGKIEKTHPKIHPMDYVYIFMASSVDKDGEPIYYKVFTGVVSKVAYDHKNQDTITISGEDVTKILRLSAYSTEQAMLRSAQIAADQSELNVLTDNIFAGKTAAQIINKLVSGVQIGLTPSKKEKISTTLYNTQESLQTLQSPSYKEADLIIDQKSKLFTEFFKANSVVIEDINEIPTLLHVAQLTPYRTIFGAKTPMYHTEYKDRLQLCREVAQIMGFEFFADADGVIHYRQPRFDLGNLFVHEDIETYICDSESMRGYSVAEDDSHVVTIARVTGSTDILGTSDELGTWADYYNNQLIDKWGARFLDVSSPLVGYTSQCVMYGKSLLRRSNADKVSAQVELNLRPALRAGNPVYIPELNQVYYVTTVTHTFSYGGDCVTSLGLQYGRTPWDVLPELLSFYSTDKADSGIYGAPAIVGKLVNNIVENTATARTLSNICFVNFFHNISTSPSVHNFDFVIHKDGSVKTGSQWNTNFIKSKTTFSGNSTNVPLIGASQGGGTVRDAFGNIVSTLPQLSEDTIKATTITSNQYVETGKEGMYRDMENLSTAGKSDWRLFSNTTDGALMVNRSINIGFFENLNNSLSGGSLAGAKKLVRYIFQADKETGCFGHNFCPLFKKPDASVVNKFRAMNGGIRTKSVGDITFKDTYWNNLKAAPYKEEHATDVFSIEELVLKVIETL